MITCRANEKRPEKNSEPRR